MGEFDAKLEHLIIHYFYATSPNNHIRLMFKEFELYQFEEFIGYDEQRLLDMRNNGSTPLFLGKIMMINDVLLYYYFMRNNNNEVMAEILISGSKETSRYGNTDIKELLPILHH